MGTCFLPTKAAKRKQAVQLHTPAARAQACGPGSESWLLGQEFESGLSDAKKGEWLESFIVASASKQS